MSSSGSSQAQVPYESRRPAPAASTRDTLVQLAAHVFATEGYAAISVRDLGRRAGVTSGAIYGNFRGKADLLAEAVDARLTSDLWTLPEDITAKSMLEIVGYQFEHFASRELLMSLLLEGAVAARGEPEVRERLQPTIEGRINASSASFEQVRVEEGYAPDADLDAATKLIWSMEIGLHVLTALGISAPSEADTADTVRRFLRGLQVQDSNDADTSEPAAKKKTAKSTKRTAKNAPKSAGRASGPKSATKKPAAS